MANIKFSEFTAETAIAAGLFVVGYDGATNKRILATDLLGNYLPLAGGTMTGATIHGTNVQSRWGSMQLYNDGTNTNFLILSGDVRYNNFGQGDDISFTLTGPTGSSSNYFKLSGQNERIEVNKDMRFGQSDKAIFNDSLEIYSTNTGASFIKDTQATEFLTIQSGADLKLQSSGGEDYIICNENTSVELYYDNVKKLETTSTGVNITGEVRVTGAYYDSSNSAGTDGQVLSSTGTGTATAWVDAGGGGGATELNDLTDVTISANTAALINVPANGVGMNSFVMGVGAGNSMTTGAQGMTIIGQDAGATLTSSDYGVYIGAFAGRYQNTTTTQGNVLIGYEAGQGSSSTTSNSYATVAIGHQALKNVTGGDRNVAIGYSALSNNLTGGTAVAIGVECGKGVTTASNSVFIGYQAAENTNAQTSVIIGTQAMDTGAASNMSSSTVVGYQAARSSTAQRTTAFGYQAAYSHTSGGNSVTIGAYAGYNNTSSGDRTIVGYGSAQYNTGAGNTSFGTNALQGPAASSGITGAYNTAIGRKSLEEITTGFFNTGVGNEALADVTTGYFNVAIGNQAGEGFQTGFQNTFVGADAGNTKTSGNNCVMLGYSAQPSTATAANEITLGNGSISSLRCAVTTITSLSDKRDKTKIEDSNYGLNVIDRLKPVTFDWNTRDGAKVGVKDLGFIAQDLQEVDDENLKLVYDTNPEKLEASYGRLIPVLVKAIQELKAEIEILKS